MSEKPDRGGPSDGDQLALRDSEEGMRLLVDSVQDYAILMLDPTGHVATWNQGAQRCKGYTAKEIIGQHFSVFYPPQDIEAGKPQWELKVAAAEGRLEDEGWRVRKDGSLFWADVVITALRAPDGSLRGYGKVTRDLTERRAAELALRDSREQALEASRLKSEFLANMSHEIRTPLNGVLGMTSLLLDSALAPDQRGLAEAVRVSGEVLLVLLNDILDFSKVEAGQLDLESIDFDLGSLVEEVADLLSLPAHSKGLELACRLPVQMPAMVRGDPGRLRQIITNLVGNAVKFTPAGEVLIDLTIEEQDEQTTTIRLEVTDTGIGIAAIDQTHLFESFSQVDASTTRRFGGTGLGLAICRQLIELMDGQIGARSQPGQGSTFWFTLSLRHAQVTAAPTTLPAELAGLRMLVVDDNATNRAILIRYLNAWEIRCDAVDGAAQAQQVIAAGVAAGDPYDALLLDLNMPETDGIQLAASIMKDPELGSPRMVLLTSSGMRGEADAARQAGITAYLTKPVRQSQLHGCLISISNQSTPAPAATTEHPCPSPRSPASGRLLLAEDNEINRIVAQTMLAKLGYEVDVVTNGAQAVKAATHTPYQAILMDCQMPVLDGYAATAQIRHLQQGSRRTPIIALTASALKSDLQRSLAAGMDDHVSKPITLQTMSAVLQRWTPTAHPAEAGLPHRGFLAQPAPSPQA